MERQENAGPTRNIGIVEMGDYLWMQRLSGRHRVIYEASIKYSYDGPMDTFIFVLHLPKEYEAGELSKCQKLAESVLNTFRRVGLEHSNHWTGPRLETYRGTSIYYARNHINAPHFEVVFDETIWQFVNTRYNGPQLIMRKEPRCILDLRAGATRRENLGTTEFAGKTWSFSKGGRHFLAYSLPHGVAGFIFGVYLPQEFDVTQPSMCQQAAELILDTFIIVSENQ